MRDPILVINAGSSSIKFSVFDAEDGQVVPTGMQGQVEGLGSHARLEIRNPDGTPSSPRPLANNDHDNAVIAIRDCIHDRLGGGSKLAAIGHRVVHGGADFYAPVLVNDRILAVIEALAPLAPLHQPHHVAAIRAFAAAAPGVPQVACFDTAFHHGQPALARLFALPRDLTARGVRRYGFHGISYEYLVTALPAAASELVGKRIVVAHLGNGASLCAIDNGRSIATTMGFTPLDGLVMGTRAGLLDAGVILYLLQHDGMSPADIETLLYERSGLLGVSGVSSDMRELLASDRPEAKEAVDLFVYRLGRELGSMAAALGGMDGLIFTAGIGENAAQIRALVCRDARWLGIELDEAANDRGGPRISLANAAASAWVIPTDENLMIARHTLRLLHAPRGGNETS
jgi:acetate kinase